MACAGAVLRERNYVVPEDVQRIFCDVCAHRLVLRPQAQVDGLTARALLEEIMMKVRPEAEVNRYVEKSTGVYPHGGCDVPVFFFFSEPFLLYAGTALILIALVVGIGMHQECRDLEVRLKVGKGVRGGEELPLEITVRTQKSPWFLRCIQMDLTIQNEMFQTTEQTRLILPLSGRANCFAMKETIPLCGEIEVTCSQIRAYDFLRLFCTEIDTLELCERRRLFETPPASGAAFPHGGRYSQVHRNGSEPKGKRSVKCLISGIIRREMTSARFTGNCRARQTA